MFKGSYVALITPFDNGKIDEDALRRLVNWHIENGTDGLVPMGTNGESSTVSHDEHKLVVRIVIEETEGRIPVIAGAGSNNPVEALEHIKYAERLGADAVLCVAGYYNRPSQDGLFEHFRYVHDASNIPIFIYNIPPRAVVDITPETMGRIAELPRVIGVKDATKDLSRTSLEQQLIKKKFSYLSGEDMTAVAYNSQGGNGCISVTANVVPAICAQMQAACLRGDYQTALKLHRQLIPLHEALFIQPSPSGAKYAASVLGLCSDEVRLPILHADESTRVKLQRALNALTM